MPYCCSKQKNHSSKVVSSVSIIRAYSVELIHIFIFIFYPFCPLFKCLFILIDVIPLAFISSKLFTNIANLLGSSQTGVPSLPQLPFIIMNPSSLEGWKLRLKAFRFIITISPIPPKSFNTLEGVG